jgi:hypothetical protein
LNGKAKLRQADVILIMNAHDLTETENCNTLEAAGNDRKWPHLSQQLTQNVITDNYKGSRRTFQAPK